MILERIFIACIDGLTDIGRANGAFLNLLVDLRERGLIYFLYLIYSESPGRYNSISSSDGSVFEIPLNNLLPNERAAVRLNRLAPDRCKISRGRLPIGHRRRSNRA